MKDEDIVLENIITKEKINGKREKLDLIIEIFKYSPYNARVNYCLDYIWHNDNYFGTSLETIKEDCEDLDYHIAQQNKYLDSLSQIVMNVDLVYNCLKCQHTEYTHEKIMDEVHNIYELKVLHGV